VFAFASVFFSYVVNEFVMITILVSRTHRGRVQSFMVTLVMTSFVILMGRLRPVQDVLLR
jgi:hypothetical protein